MTAWYDGIPAVEERLRCGHLAVWRRGRLLLDGVDPTAEEVLAALGAERCSCLDVLDLWRAGLDDSGISTALTDFIPRVHIDDVRARFEFMRKQAERVKGGEAVTVGTYHAEPVGPQRADLLRHLGELQVRELRYATLLALPVTLRERLAFAAIVCASRLSRHPSPGVAGAVSRRATPALEEGMRSWRARLAPRHRVRADCEVTLGPARLEGTMDNTGGWASVRLPPVWLVDVWAWGLAVVDGCFVLSIDRRVAADEVEVQAVRWERGAGGRSEPVAARALAVRSPGRHWALLWR